jgi:hypothetical protein
VDLTPAGRERVEVLDNEMNKGKPLLLVWTTLDVDEYEALVEHVGRQLRTPHTMLRVLVREFLHARGWTPGTFMRCMMGAGVVLFLLLSSPALAGSVRCTTYEEKSLQRLQTVCSDGTRATSYWSPSLQTWQTTVTPPPGQTCTGMVNPTTRAWEGRCQ